MVVPGRGLPAGPFASEAELIELVEQAEADSVIERGESLMLQRVVHLGDTVAREVQVPRTDMVTLEQGTGLERAMRLHLRSGFSRVPVVGRDADDVVGVSYLKDVAAHLQDLRTGEHVEHPTAPWTTSCGPRCSSPRASPPTTCCARCRPARSTSPSSSTSTAASPAWSPSRTCSRRSSGRSPTSTTSRSPRSSCSAPSGGGCPPRTHLTALSEITDRDVEDDEVDTVAGLLAKHLGRVPIRGSSVEVSGLRITADRRGRRNRLLSVVVEVLPEPDEDDDDDDRPGRARGGTSRRARRGRRPPPGRREVPPWRG